MSKRKVMFTYERISEESASEGEAAEYGWADPDGGRYPIGGSEMDESQIEDVHERDVGIEVSSAREAVELIRDTLNGLEPSSDGFHPTVFYSDSDDRVDYSTGDAERLSAHLHGFDPRQERAVWNALVGGRGGYRRAK